MRRTSSLPDMSPPRRSATPNPEGSSSLVFLTESAPTGDRERRTIELLGLLAFALRSFTNIPQFLEVVPPLTGRLLGAEGSCLLVLGRDGRFGLQGFHSEDRALGTQWVSALQGGLVACEDTGTLESLLLQVLGEGYTVHTVAVLGREGLLGYLCSFGRGLTWDDLQAKLLRAIADLTGSGIESHRLAAVVQRKEIQDRELEIGAEIQRQLLPLVCPDLPGVSLAARCWTANRVGGDCYDFIPLEKGTRWGIAVGDVMGKGVPAGLLATMTRGMLRAEALRGLAPAATLQALNAAMYEDLERSHRFLTLFYAEYDPQTRILSYGNAAHPPALWWRARQGSLRMLDAAGSLIGLDGDSQYEEGRVRLQPGDVVVVYTDGLTEAMGANGDRFEEDRLRACLEAVCPRATQASEVLEAVLAAVRDFVGDRPCSDDMTAVVLRVQS
ncbi:MAG TPA: guanylate cyclase [Cyanobacteria bacterium UBA8156]|nr:guanylate cyclase [Cyanobacteria bacterium UBA8156]